MIFILKRISNFCLKFLVSVLFIVFLFWCLNIFNTSYLKIDKENTSNSYLIRNVNVVPMTADTLLINKVVLVKEGRVVKISDSVFSNDLPVIDGENQFLSPGLIDMHTHVWDKHELGLYLANGVTTIRNLWGYSMHLNMKEEIDAGSLIGPNLFVSSPKLTGKNDLGDDKVQVEDVETAVQLVYSYKKRGFDFIKIYAGIPKDIYDAVLVAAENKNLEVVSHPTREIPYLEQFHSQIKSFEHAEEIVQQAMKYKLDSLKLKEVVVKFKESNTSFCPTLTGFYKIYELLNSNESLFDSQIVGYMNPMIKMVDSKAQYNRWQNHKLRDSLITRYVYNQHQFHMYMVKSMQDAGVNLICGTDAGIGITVPGYSIHEELDFYKKAGLSNYETLSTATVNPTRTHAALTQFGTIEIGKWANMVLTKKNPLEDLKTLKNPEWVMVSGRKIDKNKLQIFKEKAHDRTNLVSTALDYAVYLLTER
jgi:imidazolonepropionase-like amidohydrolase